MTKQMICLLEMSLASFYNKWFIPRRYDYYTKNIPTN